MYHIEIKAVHLLKKITQWYMYYHKTIIDVWQFFENLFNLYSEGHNFAIVNDVSSLCSMVLKIHIYPGKAKDLHIYKTKSI